MTSPVTHDPSQLEVGYVSDRHASFPRPNDQHATLWRYVDLAKLVFLLATKTLHFARTDTLDDPFEGYGIEPEGGWLARREDRRQLVTRIFSTHRARLSTAVSCWHMNERESAAMWKLYVSGGGVCIRSSFARLTEALPRSQSSRAFAIRVGNVLYEDTGVSRGNLDALDSVMRKRRSFEHEQEIRAVIHIPLAVDHMTRLSEQLLDQSIGRLFGISSHEHLQRMATKGYFQQVRELWKLFLDRYELNGISIIPLQGISVPVDPGKLIERIYVAPTSPLWFADVVRSVVRQYGVDVEVHQSRLAGEPIF